MARVICNLPNASTLIDGVTFLEDRGEMISAEIDDAAAARFVGICAGFRLAAPPVETPAGPVGTPAVVVPDVAGAPAPDAPADAPRPRGKASAPAADPGAAP